MTEAEQAEFDEDEAALEDSMPSYQEHRRTFRQFEEACSINLRKRNKAN
jgi:hypothetical protein